MYEHTPVELGLSERFDVWTMMEKRPNGKNGAGTMQHPAHTIVKIGRQ